MRRQCGVELRRVVVRKFDPPAAELLGRGLGDRGLRLRPRIGFGSRFEFDRGAQLVDRGDPRQLRVMLIRSLSGPGGDDAELIQRQPTLPHALGTLWELLEPARHGGDRVGVARGHPELPGHQRRHRPRTRSTAQLVAIELGDDLHDASINRVALTGQLRQLLKQHLKALARARCRSAQRCGHRHTPIIAAGYDKSRPPESAGVRVRFVGSCC
ncbi:hypothetical protein LAUMK13_05759 [Mycobacterium innocens]|uniref:Uncharacterized protein n=1 Tax=Mycobacterium innocens TaxID=2341083 RepID=A0A498QM35_9MYCO|nr:hypothetical protein LAUMK13_05759 [Mycobacterium innocens]